MNHGTKVYVGSFIMRATFANQLVFAEPGRKDSIKYRHPFRVDVDIYIQQASRTGQNWDIQYKGHKFGRVPDPIREALARELQNYIRLRVKKNIRSLSFSDFIDMANAMNIA